MTLNQTVGKSSIYRPTFIVKEYTPTLAKLIVLKSLRQSGWELEVDRSRKSSNALKSTNSVSRTRSKIFEYAICNDFDYFVTLTINKDKYDRTNLKEYYKDFSRFLKYHREKYNVDIQYLFIPELHSDGISWHMHGLLKGIPEECIGKNKNGYLDWFDYSKKFGFISLDKIRDKKACSLYITKYISKDLNNCIKDYNARMYYASKGLKKAREIYRGDITDEILGEPDFQNDYVKIYWIEDKSSTPEKERVDIWN